MVETKDGPREGLKRGKRVVAYLSAEVMADLERVAQHYSLSKSEVIAEAVNLPALNSLELEGQYPNAFLEL